MSRKVFRFMLPVLFTFGILLPSLHIQPANAQSGTVYIRADGSIDPPESPISTADNFTYTLTGNITSDTDGIVVEKDNIMVDGSGYTVRGSNTSDSMGVALLGRSTITVQKMSIEAFYYGICINCSSNNIIIGNNLTANPYCGIELDTSFDNTVIGNNVAINCVGIQLYSSSNNTVDGNNVTAHRQAGIYLALSSNNSINGNTFTDDGLIVWDSYSNTMEDNTVNDRPLVYLENASDYTVEDAGQIVLVSCNRITVENLNLSHTTIGVELWRTNNTKISGNNMTNNYCDIGVFFSSNNSIYGNSIAESNYCSIRLYVSSSNSIDGNNIAEGKFGNLGGIWLDRSSNNNVRGNTVANCNRGIWLDLFNFKNSINENTVTNNNYGIYLVWSSNNAVSHNNFINNTVQVRDLTPEYTNVWDNGCEGNYWSNYNGMDTDNDGVGDTFLPWEGVDNYPLMNVYWNPCDINHDLKVDMRDISVSAKAFGTVPGDTLWNPHADTTGPELLVSDGKVDMRDVGLVAKHFGEHYPQILTDGENQDST